MAGYDDTRKKILDSLLQRPNKTQIQPEAHQDFALSLLEYIRSVELITASTLLGVANPDTMPVQSNLANESYIAGVAQDRTVVFNNFPDVNGNPIEVITGEMEAKLVILTWNRQYWSKIEIGTNIVSQSEKAYFYYNFIIRKTYESIAEMEADKLSPLGNDGKKIKIGEVVSVHNENDSSEDAIFSYDNNGEPYWRLQCYLSNIDSRHIDGGSVTNKADLIQFRRDTAERWTEFNPILAEGELGFVLDKPNNYKVGDGIHDWNTLPLRGFNGNIVNTLGSDYDAVMSQWGLTNILNHIISNDSHIDISEGWDILDTYGGSESEASEFCGIYSLINNTTPSYYMIITAHKEGRVITQWIFGDLTIKEGKISDLQTNKTTQILWRSIDWEDETPIEDYGKWSEWHYFQDNFISSDENLENNLPETSLAPSLKYFKEAVSQLQKNTPIILDAKEWEDLVQNNEIDEERTYYIVE